MSVEAGPSEVGTGGSRMATLRGPPALAPHNFTAERHKEGVSSLHAMTPALLGCGHSPGGAAGLCLAPQSL